jgi:pantoate kinase
MAQVEVFANQSLVRQQMKNSAAFSPCNITGFFRIHSDRADPLRAGSTGASVGLSTGVTTRVRLRKARTSIINASFNGRPLPKKSVSSYVARRYLEVEGNPWNLEIAHTGLLPMGCGYGTSGAGALSLSLALNESMKLSLTTIEAAQIAHISEIECKTGLGTVTSVFSGGLVVRTIPGAPGFAEITKIHMPESLRLVTATYGPIPTSSILGSVTLNKTINNCGKELIARFDPHHAQASFTELSRRFSHCLALMSRRLERIISQLDEAGFKSSMAMLGESLFCIVPHEDASQICKVMEAEHLTPVVTSIAEKGAHLL